MALAEFVKYGTPIMLLALIILNVYQSTIIRQLQREFSDFKKSITWSDTCNERHVSIDRRLDKLEETG